MMDTRTTPGHETARALAVAVASLRHDPPPGLEVLESLDWEGLHSISMSHGRDPRDIEIAVETMRRRQPHGTRAVLSARLPCTHVGHAAVDDALDALLTDRSAIARVQVMIAFPGWETTVSAHDGEDVSIWGCPESLALTASEWDDFIVQRDADDRERGMHAANALLRVAMRLEHMVASHHDRDYRHWTRVDAEILRRAALREHPSLDPDFVPRIVLAA